MITLPAHRICGDSTFKLKNSWFPVQFLLANWHTPVLDGSEIMQE